MTSRLLSLTFHPSTLTRAPCSRPQFPRTPTSSSATIAPCPMTVATSAPSARNTSSAKPSWSTGPWISYPWCAKQQNYHRDTESQRIYKNQRIYKDTENLQALSSRGLAFRPRELLFPELTIKSFRERHRKKR